MKLETALVHVGEPHVDGSIAMPVFQSSTYAYEDGESVDYDDIRYLRLNNSPNHIALHAKLAAIDGAEAALVTSSGMAAISTTLMTFVNPGDHVLVQRGIYGGTFSFIRQEFERLGIEWSLVDGANRDEWEALRRPETVALYLETFANPTLEVADPIAAGSFGAEHGILTIVDNTFATPVNFRPIEHGVDIVVQSATKYLNGHSDLVAGAVTGSKEHVEAVRHALNHWGGTLDPHACVLLQRGLKTLALRVRQQNATARTLAEALSEHPGVSVANYPTLSTNPRHEFVADQMAGGGGVLSFELADGSPHQFISRLRYATRAPSLGGTETLVDIPAESSHAGLTPEERADVGITDRLIRVAVGIEATSDIVDDFVGALG